jgi:hypothetical protein
MTENLNLSQSVTRRIAFHLQRLHFPPNSYLSIDVAYLVIALFRRFFRSLWFSVPCGIIPLARLGHNPKHTLYRYYWWKTHGYGCGQIKKGKDTRSLSKWRHMYMAYRLLLLLRWLYIPMRTFTSLMDFSRSSLIYLTFPRSHLRFPNCWLFPGWGRQPHAQSPTWRTTSPYLYPLETGWPSYTPRHRVTILVAFYDIHGLQWDYSFPRSPHGEAYRLRLFERGRDTVLKKTASHVHGLQTYRNESWNKSVNCRSNKTKRLKSEYIRNRYIYIWVQR